ncbi:hypothetical protein SAMN05421847_1065 [Halpernia humi]|uniref:Uncharacterized protein n=1 Tax=Halpernia humi TaxID=493375 RepID=A0A1H5W0L8_9FLAO|nr:hypothetical protein [Halpernia humi]SEF93020.1 hypothetical protein SAMN05421847_1065 [Halpernia humi]
MDIQTRKIAFVQEFLKVQSEELNSLLECLLKSKDEDIKPFTIEEFNERIDKSLEDSKNDRVTKSSQLLSEINQW